MTSNELRSAIAPILPDIIGLRRYLHENPELSGGETETARRVAEILTACGIGHETGVGGTYGVVATIVGGAGPGPTFALRGDMDALPIQEENDVPYRSRVPGVMHACGHDGHTANLMGAARVLHAMRDSLKGTIKLIFQPAEETVRGADAIVAAGVIDDVDAILMLHGWPDLPAGKIGVRNGPVMASADSFTLRIDGKGGHGAYPHKTIDPVVVGAQIVTALQTVVSREVSPLQPAVVSVTMFHAGTARNVIPERAELAGTVRALDPALRKELPTRIERVIRGVCDAMQCTYHFDYDFGTPVTVNDPGVTDLVRRVGRDLLGAENVVELPEPTMGAEDFAFYVERIPGAMFRLGVGCPYLLHTPKYDFGDAPLETGMLMMVETARRFVNGE